MKEKFFYLEQKYGVHLVVNNEFGKKGNLYSLYVVRQYLSNSFICCADHYFVTNPFIEEIRTTVHTVQYHIRLGNSGNLELCVQMQMRSPI